MMTTAPNQSQHPEDPLETAGGDSMETGCLARALALSSSGKTDEALRELETGLRPLGLRPGIWSAIGKLQYGLHRYEEAARSYLCLLMLQPKNGAAHFERARCLEKVHRWSEAAE